MRPCGSLSVLWVVTFDADGQHRPEDAMALVARARKGDVDVVLGTRFGEGMPVEAGRGKQLLLRLAIIYTRAETKMPLTDAHNGLRALHRDFLQTLRIRDRGMGPCLGDRRPGGDVRSALGGGPCSHPLHGVLQGQGATNDQRREHPLRLPLQVITWPDSSS